MAYDYAECRHKSNGCDCAEAVETRRLEAGYAAPRYEIRMAVRGVWPHTELQSSVGGRRVNRPIRYCVACLVIVVVALIVWAINTDLHQR